MRPTFDVLVVDGRPVHSRPYWERRHLLERLELTDDHWSTTPSYREGEALWRSARLVWKASSLNAAATTFPVGVVG
jgi:ATP-dependent DNA ligase